MTLPARVLETALGKEAAFLREKLEKAEGGMKKGLWRKMKAVEESAEEGILAEAPVIVSTCIAAGIVHFQYIGMSASDCGKS